MPKLEQVGNFSMRITDVRGVEARFKDIAGNEVIKNDPKAFTLMIFLETSDGLTSVHYMDFTRQVITKGKFYDKWVQTNSRPPTRVDEALDKLEELGVPNGLPQELQKIMEAGQTIEVNASIKAREYTQNGVSKISYEAKYLNSARKEIAIKDMDFSLLLPETAGKSAPNAKPSTVAKPIEVATDNDSFEVEDENAPTPF